MKQIFSLLLCLCTITMLFQTCATDSTTTNNPQTPAPSAISTTKTTTSAKADPPSVAPQAKEDRRNNVPTTTTKETTQKTPTPPQQVLKNAQTTKKTLLQGGEQAKTKDATNKQLSPTDKKMQIKREPMNMDEMYIKRGEAMGLAYCNCLAKESPKKCKDTLQKSFDELAKKLPAEGNNLLKTSYDKAIADCK